MRGGGDGLLRALLSLSTLSLQHARTSGGGAAAAAPDDVVRL